MQNLNMYCLTINEDHLEPIKKLGYLPVGLGNNIKSKEFIRDNTSLNISKKNPHYGEYTFHYWIWKNYLKKIDTEWVGFCQYRKFFVNENSTEKSYHSFESLKKNIIQSIPSNLTSYDCILGKKSYVNNYKFMIFIKQNTLKTLTSLNILPKIPPIIMTLLKQVSPNLSKNLPKIVLTFLRFCPERANA